MIYKVFFTAVLISSSVFVAKPSASDSSLAIKKFHEFCKQDELMTSIAIFRGIYWLPPGFSANSSRSLKEGKLIYSNFCGAYQDYFERLFKDDAVYPYANIEVGKISDCRICTEEEINKLKLTVAKLNKTTKIFSDFTMNEVTMAYEGVDKLSLVVLYDKEKYMLFFGVDIKYVENGISLYEKFKKEKIDNK